MTRVRFVPVGPVRCGSQAWSSQGKRHVTMIVKASFSPGPGGALALVDDPDEVLARDEHHGKNPTRSLRDCSDQSPYLGRAEVIFLGAAHVASGSASLARLVVARGSALVDKTVRVAAPAGAVGDRVAVPLTWENAAGGPGRQENPVGSSHPLVTDPRDASRPAGMAPIARTWRARSDLLRPEQRKVLQQRHVDLGEAFPWDYFHAAPADQRAPSFFVGDETITLEHLWPGADRVALRLPDARAEARVLSAEGAPVPVRLALDLIRIDGDRRRVTLTWRGYAPFEAERERLVVAAGLSIGGAPIAWPEVAPEEPEEPESGGRRPSAPGLDATAHVQVSALAASTLPFDARDDAEAAPRPSGPPIAGAPWAGPASSGPRPSPMQQLTASPGAALATGDAMMRTAAVDGPAASRPAVPFAARRAPAPPAAVVAPPVSAPSAASASLRPQAIAVPAQAAPVAPARPPPDVVLSPGAGSRLLLAFVAARAQRRSGGGA